MPRTPEYTDDDFLMAVQRHAPAGTSEVADEVGCTRPLAHERLNDLADDGDIKRKQIGKVVVWYTECQ